MSNATQTFKMLLSCVQLGAEISLNQALDTECTETEPEGTEHLRWSMMDFASVTSGSISVISVTRFEAFGGLRLCSAVIFVVRFMFLISGRHITAAISSRDGG